MKEFELEPGEHVVMQVRKHWFLFVVGLLPFLVLALVPFLVPGLLRLSPVTGQFAAGFNYGTDLGRVGLSIWLLTIWTLAWGAFTRYFLNVWILTSQRIVTIKQRRYFAREVSSLLLTRVQDVTTDVDGVLPSVLGIGDIKVQSAGAEVEFTMRGIPRPEQMRNLIIKYIPEEPKPVGV
jgi:hypothetical protein